MKLKIVTWNVADLGFPQGTTTKEIQDADQMEGPSKTVRIVILRVADLNFPEGATTQELIGTEQDTDQHGHAAPFTRGRGQELGLVLCPPDVGPLVRLEYTEQPLDEQLHVAMKPIESSDGEPRILSSAITLTACHWMPRGRDPMTGGVRRTNSCSARNQRGEKRASMSRAGSAHSHLGDQGELWFAAALPRGWVWQPPRRDFGKDGLIVIRDGSELHNLEFSVQIKTSARPKIRDGHVILSGISRSSIRYWFASPLPTLVVAVDLANRTGWFAWHLDLFDSPLTLFHGTADTVTLRIPQANRLDQGGWTTIRNDVLRHFKALHRALSVDAVAPHLLGTVHSIARIVGNLIRLSATPPPHEDSLTQKEGLSLLIEQIELRDLMAVVRSLLRRIVEGSDAHKQITFWLTAFEATAVPAHPSLRTFPPGHEIPGDFELAVAPTLLLEVRPQLIVAAVDLIRLLTSPLPAAEPTKG